MDNYERLIAEYPEEICLYLEATYSEGMMSEGGTIAVERMFRGVALNHKCLLEIGFGLGGAAFTPAGQ